MTNQPRISRIKNTMTVAKVRQLREAFRKMPLLQDFIGCARMLGGCGQIFNSQEAFNAHACPEEKPKP